MALDDRRPARGRGGRPRAAAPRRRRCPARSSARSCCEGGRPRISALLLHQRLDRRPIDHDRLARAPLPQRARPEQQRAEHDEMHQRLAPEEAHQARPAAALRERPAAACSSGSSRSAAISGRAGRRRPGASDALAAGRELDALGRDAMADRPAEPVLGRAGRKVLAADPARIAQPVEQLRTDRGS